MKKICLFLFFILIASESFGADGVDNVKRSVDVARHASILLRDGRLEEALAEYRKAEALNPDEAIRGIMEEIQSQIIKDAENKAMAESLRRQARMHISDGHLDLAIEKFERSLIHYDDSDVRQELAVVEGRFKAETQKQRSAQEIFRIAERLELRGELDAALSKLEEAQNVWDLPQILPLRRKIQEGIRKNQADSIEASNLAEEAIKLEVRANASQENDMELLERALENFKKSYALVPALTVEMAIIQVEQSILKVRRDIEEAEKRSKEARFLEEQGKLEAALEVYNISLGLRQNEEVARDLKALENKINEVSNRERQANELYAEAAKLEADGKISEALVIVNNALEILQTPEGDALKLRIERAVTDREQRRARGAELAERARDLRGRNLFTEALDMYWESWAAWPYSMETKDAIDSLESVVKDQKTTEERAKKLYNEGLALEGEARLAEAIERITGSLSLLASKEAEEKLADLKADLSYKKWLDAMLIQPLELKSEPVIPMIGQSTAVRIEGSSWLDSEKLAYKWELSGNAKDVENTDGGRAVNFRPGDEAPAVVRLEVYAKEAKDPRIPIMEKRLSVMPNSYTMRINFAGINSANHRKWNPVRKMLESVSELVTRSDIPLRAEIFPFVEEAVYEWILDKETLISGDIGKEINVRRNAPGLSKIEVIAKDNSGIEIGRAETSFVVSVAYEDILIDLQRAEAWEIWLEAEKLWAEQKRREAIKKAAEASSLDPSDPDISMGLSRLHNDNAIIEEAYYLSAVSSLRMLEGREEEAVLTMKESERLVPDGKKRLLISNLEAELNERQNKIALAERLRAEGDWLLGQQRKVEAISKYRDSLLLQKNEHIAAEILRIAEEIENETRTREERKELLQRAFSLVSKQRFTEAMESFSQALTLHEDEPIKIYAATIEYRVAEEEELKERASKIREEADSLFNAKKFPEAFDVYRSSLEVWGDNDLELWLAGEEKKYKDAQALQLRRDAEQLMRQRNRREDAVELYRESLKFAYDKAADDIVREADAARAGVLIAEAEALLRQNKPEEALERYKLALTKVPGHQRITDEINKLETALLKAVAEPGDAAVAVESKPEENAANQNNSEQLIAADRFLKEANSLYSEKKYNEALFKYKESYELSKNERLKEFIDRFEKTIEDVEKANSFLSKANDLYKQGKYQEALENYKESLNAYKNPQVEEFIARIEALID